VLAGTGLSLRYLYGDFAAIVTSEWGRTLLIKLALLGGVAGLGAWNSRVMRARLGSDESALQMRKSAVTELVLAFLLLGATAALVAMPLPGE
jgi:putative copper export protein